MFKEKILIIEDDKNISKLLKYNLEKAGYACSLAGSGHDAWRVLAKENVDMIILDIMLPEMDGFEVCRCLKHDHQFRDIPIIMLTAKGEERNRIVGLELGADDYVVKPFSPREFVLRVKAVFRRRSPGKGKKDVLIRGVISVDVSCHKVTVDGKDIDLTPMEFKLLVTFLQRTGRVQTRDRLLSEIWDIHTDGNTRTVDTHVKRLREKLGSAGKFIETVVGLGYRLRQEDDEN